MRRSEHLSSTHLGRCRPAGPRQRGLEIFNGWKRARRRERSLLRAVQQSRIHRLEGRTPLAAPAALPAPAARLSCMLRLDAAAAERGTAARIAAQRARAAVSASRTCQEAGQRPARACASSDLGTKRDHGVPHPCLTTSLVFGQSTFLFFFSFPFFFFFFSLFF